MSWSYLSYRFKRIRPVLQGEPIVLVENGQLIKRNMDRERPWVVFASSAGGRSRGYD